MVQLWCHLSIRLLLVLKAVQRAPLPDPWEHKATAHDHSSAAAAGRAVTCLLRLYFLLYVYTQACALKWPTSSKEGQMVGAG